MINKDYSYKNMLNLLLNSKLSSVELENDRYISYTF